jgi:hypothetical protein
MSREELADTLKKYYGDESDKLYSLLHHGYRAHLHPEIVMSKNSLSHMWWRKRGVDVDLICKGDIDAMLKQLCENTPSQGKQRPHLIMVGTVDYNREVQETRREYLRADYESVMFIDDDTVGDDIYDHVISVACCEDTCDPDVTDSDVIGTDVLEECEFDPEVRELMFVDFHGERHRIETGSWDYIMEQIIEIQG